MKVIERARAHFGRLSMAPIEVPEWPDEDGKPTIVYSEPMTLRDKQKISRLSDQVGEIEVMANVLILRARDAQGHPMFTLEDKQLLLTQVDPGVLSRIAVAVTRSATVKEQEKN